MKQIPIVIGQSYGPFEVLGKRATATLTTNTTYDCKCTRCGDISVRPTCMIKAADHNGQRYCVKCPEKRCYQVGQVYGAYEVLERLGRRDKQSFYRVRCTRCASELVRSGCGIRSSVRGKRRGCRHCVQGGTVELSKLAHKYPTEHATWHQWKSRCSCPTHPGYKLYGAKGVRMCDRWLDSFVAFIEDVGPRPAEANILALVPGNDVVGPGSVLWIDRREHAQMYPTRHK